MNHTLNRAILTLSVVGMIVSVPVVAAFMAGLDRPTRTEVSLYDGGVEGEAGDRTLTASLYVFAPDGVVVRGIQIGVIGRSGRTLGFDRYGDAGSTTRFDVSVPLPEGTVSVVRVRVDEVTGANLPDVRGLEVDDDGVFVQYSEPRLEYEY